jgi:hypothetical protein
MLAMEWKAECPVLGNQGSQTDVESCAAFVREFGFPFAALLGEIFPLRQAVTLRFSPDNCDDRQRDH